MRFYIMSAAKVKTKHVKMLCSDMCRTPSRSVIFIALIYLIIRFMLSAHTHTREQRMLLCLHLHINGVFITLAALSYILSIHAY